MMDSEKRTATGKAEPPVSSRTSVTLSVIIPMHNEGGNVTPLLTALTEALRQISISYEIIAVDDHSSDTTFEELVRWRREKPSLNIIKRRDGHRGVGFNYRAAFAVARGDILSTMDGDLSHDPVFLPELLRGLSRGDFVIGSRFVKGGSADLFPSRKFATFSFNYFVRNLFRVRARDLTSGYRVFRKWIVENVQFGSGSFDIYPELAIVASLRGARIVEVPIKYSRRLHGKSNLDYRTMLPRYVKLIVRLVAQMPNYKRMNRKIHSIDN